MSVLQARPSSQYKPNPVLADMRRRMHHLDAEAAYDDWEERFLIREYDYYRVVFPLADAMGFEGNEANNDKLLDSIKGGDIKAAQDALESILHYAAEKYAQGKLDKKLEEMEDDRINAEWESRRYDEALWH